MRTLPIICKRTRMMASGDCTAVVLDAGRIINQVFTMASITSTLKRHIQISSVRAVWGSDLSTSCRSPRVQYSTVVYSVLVQYSTLVYCTVGDLGSVVNRSFWDHSNPHRLLEGVNGSSNSIQFLRSFLVKVTRRYVARGADLRAVAGASHTNSSSSPVTNKYEHQQGQSEASSYRAQFAWLRLRNGDCHTRARTYGRHDEG